MERTARRYVTAQMGLVTVKAEYVMYQGVKKGIEDHHAMKVRVNEIKGKLSYQIIISMVRSRESD